MDLVNTPHGPSQPLPRRRLPVLTRIQEAEPDDEYASDDSARTVRPPLAAPPPLATAAPRPIVPPRPPPPPALNPSAGPDEESAADVMSDLCDALQLDCPELVCTPDDLPRLEARLPRLQDTLSTYVALRQSLSRGEVSSDFVWRAQAARHHILSWEQRRAFQCLQSAMPTLSAAIERRLAAQHEPAVAQQIARGIDQALAERLARLRSHPPQELSAIFDLEQWLQQVVARAHHRDAPAGHGDAPEVSAAFVQARRSAELYHLLDMVADIDGRAIDERLNRWRERWLRN